MLGPTASKIASAAWDHAPGPPSWRFLGLNLGAKISHLFRFVGVVFWTLFGEFLDHLWGHFGVFFWDQIGPIEGKMSPKRPVKRFKILKTCIYENLKKHVCFKLFGVHGRPRQSLKSQEGSQEAPEELQNLRKKRSKNRPTFYYFVDQFWNHFGIHFGPTNC